MIYSLEEIAGLLRPILERYHARGASIFGSYARGEASSDSDLDVIVHGGPDFHRTDVFSIAEDLFDASGKRVDVFDESELTEDSDFAKQALGESIVII